METKTTEMYISFRRLDEMLKSKKLPWSYLRNGISPGIIEKMKKGTGHVDTRTIQEVCRLLDCQPGDFMEYVSPTEGGTEK